MNLRDLTAKSATRIHRTFFDLSKGKIGGKAGGLPVVRLTTKGRKSGKERVSMLLSPVQDGDRVILVASYGGAEYHPAWYLNLSQNPAVRIRINRQDRSMKARTADSEEKAALWPEVVKAYPAYRRYQEKATRDIPVVILQPD